MRVGAEKEVGMNTSIWGCGGGGFPEVGTWEGGQVRLGMQLEHSVLDTLNSKCQ